MYILYVFKCYKEMNLLIMIDFTAKKWEKTIQQ